MKIDFSGKRVLVTGGSGGIGRVIVRTLAECGADVGIHYHSDKQKAEELVKEITGQYGVRAAAFRADLTKETEVQRLREEMEQTLGMPELLVVNAVIQYPYKFLLEQPIGDFYSQFESTVMHNVYMFKAFAPAMLEKGAGKFVVINTECSMRCDPGAAAYSSAKRGLDGLCRSFAKEVGPKGITVNQVAPGWMVTEQQRENGVQWQGAYTDTVPMKRRGTDEDIADAVLFFASDLSNYITGAYLSVSGGRVMPTI